MVTVRLVCFLGLVFLSSCGNGGEQRHSDQSKFDNASTGLKAREEVSDSLAIEWKEENERFRNISIFRDRQDSFIVRGEARVYEGTVSWVVEDGHLQLSKGFVTAEQGAPGWGEFTIKVSGRKKNPHTTLHLILFEESPQDGSRQFILPIPLH